MKKRGITKAAARKFHAERGNPPKLTAAEHDRLMQHLGVSKEQDTTWHASHGVPWPQPDAPAPPRRSLNPFAIGGGFLNDCVSRGWIEREGSGRSARCFAMAKGTQALQRFGIPV